MIVCSRFSFAVLPALLGLAMSLTVAGSFNSSGASIVVSTSPVPTDSGLPTPEEVLAECLMKFDMIVAGADEDIADERDDTIEDIEYQRENGAAQKKINKTAKSGKKAVQSDARSALAEINRTNGDCLINLIRRGADREMLAELNDEAKRSVRALKRIVNDAYDAIDEAAAAP